MARLTWQCQCGNVLFSLQLRGREAPLDDRYAFAVECPKCGRMRRRCLWLAEGNYLRAKSMLKAMYPEFMARPMWSGLTTTSYANAVSPWAGKLITRMLRRGFTTGEIHSALAARMPISMSVVYNAVCEHDQVEFDLVDAPPFCHDHVRGLQADFPDEMLRMRKGHILNLCPFCMLKCNSNGEKCKMIKQSSGAFRFVQLGKD